MRSRLVSRRTSAFTCVEPDERVELGEQLLDRSRRRQLGRPAPRSRRPRRRSPAAPAAPAPGWPGPRRRRRRRTPASSTSRKRSMAAISSGDGTRSIAAAAWARRIAERRSSGRRGAVPSRASARERAGRTACSGGSSQRRLPVSISLSRSRSDETSTGGSSRGADVVEPRLAARRSDGRSSLSITAATRSPASTATSARWSRPDSSPQLGVTPSTNASTYLASDPGHRRASVRTASRRCRSACDSRIPIDPAGQVRK